MAVRIVQLGSPRAPGEGLRIGTVRRPPRGVPRSEFARRNYYDVWLPELAPSDDLVKQALLSRNDKNWQQFVKKYRAEMKQPAATRLLGLLSAMSRESSFAVGCYCDDEAHCHRSVLRALLEEHGALVK